MDVPPPADTPEPEPYLPPLPLILIPAVTLTVGPLLVTAGWDLGAAMTGLLGTAVSGWCAWRGFLTALTLMYWNVSVTIWAGYDLVF